MSTAEIAWFFVQGLKKISQKIRAPSRLAATVGTGVFPGYLIFDGNLYFWFYSIQILELRIHVSFVWEPPWLEALLTSVLDLAWLGFNLRLGVGSGLRLDSKLSLISWARVVSRWSRMILELDSSLFGSVLWPGSAKLRRLCLVLLCSGISRQICNKYVCYIVASNKCVWSNAILPAPDRM